jgi:L-rhamnose mutarotase
MKRLGMMIGIKENRIEEYKKTARGSLASSTGKSH